MVYAAVIYGACIYMALAIIVKGESRQLDFVTLSIRL
jgi:hypothetical protein